MDMLKATCSAVVELRVMSVWSLLDHKTGQPKRINTNPVLDLTEVGS